MSRLWNRKANVIFSLRGTGQGTKHSGLRVEFEIEKTSESNSNGCKVKVYNLNKTSRAFLEQENVVVILEVGYEDNIDQLFIGDIIKSATEKIETDLVTTIEAKDGNFTLENSNIDKSYKAGTDLKDVAKDVIKSMQDTGAIVVNSIDAIQSEVLQNGMSISGASKKILDNITKKQGLEYSIQDNELQVTKQGGSTTEEVILLTPETGLIGTPIKREKGMEFKSLIQTTKIRPGRRIKIVSSDLEGVFTIRKAKYKGDTHGNPWFVTGEVIIDNGE